MMREKYSHLTYVQKVWLYSRYKTHGEDVRTICQKYGISASTMKSILKIFENNQKSSAKLANVGCRKKIYSPAVGKLIADFI